MLNDMESSDFANWADSDSECSSDDSGSDFVLSNYDPELQDGVDTWNCVNCGQPNTPYMRYCHRCWEVSLQLHLKSIILSSILILVHDIRKISVKIIK